MRPAQTRSEGRGRTASGSHQPRPRARALGQKGFRSGRNRRGVGGVDRRGGGRVPGQLLLAGGRWRVVTSARPLRAVGEGRALTHARTRRGAVARPRLAAGAGLGARPPAPPAEGAASTSASAGLSSRPPFLPC